MQAARYAAELARATGGSVVLARAVSEAVARSRAYPARPPEDRCCTRRVTSFAPRAFQSKPD